MSAPRIYLDHLPSFCQRLSKSVEIWRSSDKNKSAQFFLRHGVVLSYIIRQAKQVQKFLEDDRHSRMNLNKKDHKKKAQKNVLLYTKKELSGANEWVLS